ncbi:helix-turn-helix domain-containing protein [Mycolicibacterium goodii]|nr:helix-turn-helix domain-containing protein [Mycolicibacterium goodii]
MDVAKPADLEGDLTLLTIPEAIAALRVGSSLFYKLMAEGTLHPLRLGHPTLIPRADQAADPRGDGRATVTEPPRVLTPLSLPEAAVALRITTRYLRTLRRQGRIRTVHLGNRVLVLHREVIRLIGEALTDLPRPAGRGSHPGPPPGQTASP